MSEQWEQIIASTLRDPALFPGCPPMPEPVDERIPDQIREENKRLRALLDLFEHYCEFRMGVKSAIQVKDIPTLRDINEARRLLGYKEIGVNPVQPVAPAAPVKVNIPG